MLEVVASELMLDSHVCAMDEDDCPLYVGLIDNLPILSKTTKLIVSPRVCEELRRQGYGH